MGFPRQEYWDGLPLPSLGDLPDPGIKPTSPTWADRLILSHQRSPNIILPWTLKKKVNWKKNEEEKEKEGRREESGEGRKNRGRKHILDLVDTALSFSIKFLEESTSSLSIHI